MTPERWQQVERLLETALAQPPAARSELLARACADDEALRQEVESLLRHHQEDDFLWKDISRIFMAGQVKQYHSKNT